jgi:DNA repair exonuclease SbcCD ATPase subunit
MVTKNTSSQGTSMCAIQFIKEPPMRAFFLTSAAVLITFALATQELAAQAPSTSPPSPSQSSRAADMGAVSKELGEEALRLTEEAARGLKRLDELQAALETDQRRTQNAKQTVEQLLSLLREGVGRLDPSGAYVRTLDAEESTVRDFANRAATNPDTEIRPMAEWFKGKADEISAIRRNAEQLRTRLLTQIDRLERQQERLEFAIAATQVESFIKNARAYLDTLSNIANGAKSLADNIANAFGANGPTQ